MISHSVITGGRFTQHIHNNRQIQLQGARLRCHSPSQVCADMIFFTTAGFDRLQEAVAPGAFHNSGERFDPPKCHPKTRVAVMNKIMDWILGQDPETKNALIMWLHGAAGAGKSAIAQSIAELCYAQGHLVASFFFGRSYANRNHAGSLFATLAYQMALVLPEVRETLHATVDYDPLKFTRSLSTQFLSLIVEPLRNLSNSAFFNNPSSPRLIIIDGLDECLDRKVQCEILDVILNGIRQHHIPLVFLIVSRPEHDISTKFNSPGMDSAVTRLLLDHSYSPDRDIELFLQEKFKEIKETHPFKQSIPTPWPTDNVIWSLVEKSSGQFIYASTVVKYVESSRHRPHHRLEVILRLRVGGDRLLTELDALYIHIFSSVDDIDQILDILSFNIMSIRIADLDDIEAILSLDPGDIELLFCDLGSLVSIPESYPDGRRRFHILHATLSDFLLDQSRSNRFYIDSASKCTEHLRKCFQFLTYTTFTDDSMDGTQLLAIDFILNNLQNYVPSAKLWDDIMSFSISHIYEKNAGSGDLISYFNQYFFPDFFAFLKRSDFKDAGQLYEHHLHSFDEALKLRLEMYYGDMHLTLLVALVNFVRVKRPWLSHQMDIVEFNSHFQLFELQPTLLATDMKHCSLLWSPHIDYIQLLSEFLDDPARSGEYMLDGKKYASAALCCLVYLCDHYSSPQNMPRQPTKCVDIIRRNTPWMWLRRIGRHGGLDKTRMWRKKQCDHLSSRQKQYTIRRSHLEDPVIAERVWSKKYSLGLEYLLYFLPRSARSEELVKFANTNTFASRSQEFPNRSKKARRAIAVYLEKMEYEEL